MLTYKSRHSLGKTFLSHNRRVPFARRRRIKGKPFPALLCLSPRRAAKKKRKKTRVSVCCRYYRGWLRRASAKSSLVPPGRARKSRTLRAVVDIVAGHARAPQRIRKVRTLRTNVAAELRGRKTARTASWNNIGACSEKRKRERERMGGRDQLAWWLFTARKVYTDVYTLFRVCWIFFCYVSV